MSSMVQKTNFLSSRCRTKNKTFPYRGSYFILKTNKQIHSLRIMSTFWKSALSFNISHIMPNFIMQVSVSILKFISTKQWWQVFRIYSYKQYITWVLAHNIYPYSKLIISTLIKTYIYHYWKLIVLSLFKTYNICQK